MTRARHTSLSFWSKVAVNWASAIWALYVITHDNAVAHTSYGAFTRFVEENVAAGSVLAVVAFNVVGLYWSLPRASMVGYILLLMAWSGVMWAVIFVAPAQPTALATVSTLCAVAWCAAVTGPHHATAPGS